MMRRVSSIGQEVKSFCARIGTDPLITQGAGGNVSWKDGGLMWVKASGTWLAEAELKEIFVPVNLTHLQDALAAKNFSVKPEMTRVSSLRPSIETLLHALMAHRVVAHLHMVEVLSYLVRANAKDSFKNLFGDSEKWIFVDYHKPGAELAEAVAQGLKTNPASNLVLMANHGLVIGGKDANDVSRTLNRLREKLPTVDHSMMSRIVPQMCQTDLRKKGYSPCSDNQVGCMAINDRLLDRLRNDWALYPDHVVFLGESASILERDYTERELNEVIHSKPPFIIVAGDGVYQSDAVTPAQLLQFRCYFDVVSRQNSEEKLVTLSKGQVAELLNWEAEVFRSSQTKSA
jgi:rhamnose utilization protein RhaD (predicted bifunctional aldolase and dehydrogenase)